jgi:centromere/kinetochore protein ZW10
MQKQSLRCALTQSPMAHVSQRPVLMAHMQTQIRDISRETIPDVESWMTNARAVQQDIERLRRLATEIVREAEADEERLAHLEDRKAHLELLEKEGLFNKRLGEALQCIYQVNDAVCRVEHVAEEKNILKALRLLAGTFTINRFDIVANLWPRNMGDDG